MASLPNPPLNFTIRSVFFIVILWIGLFCIAEINAGGDVGEVLGKGGSKQREFDYFKLSLQWPVDYRSYNSKDGLSSSGASKQQDRRYDAISSTHYGLMEHSLDGLWPDYNDGTWPACCTGKRFDVKELSTLLGALNEYWPSLSCGSSSNCHGGKGLFWEHEISMLYTRVHVHVSLSRRWNTSKAAQSSYPDLEKHGTCSSSVTGDEYTYFLTALNVYFKYNVTEVLREAGYVASNSEKYPLGGIISAIQNAFHATPELECSGDALQELHLCFYKDFKPRDCAGESSTGKGMVTSKKSCPKYVSLPEYVSLKLGNYKSEVSESTLQSSI
ncbi:hypothetical protein DH2020_021999 [Rehmannia glutinosa]|uniref:Uncharacterized protein n=1 Tax=Rehmannia glutinosa TaxID=99300 RepID=A0ABR0WDN3_REHGL